MGDLKMACRKELEPGCPKTMNFPVGVQAAYDANNLYLRFSWKAAGGAARPVRTRKPESS